MPSGIVHSHLITVWTTLEVFTLRVEVYNIAEEAGWYTVEVYEAHHLVHYWWLIFFEDSYEFDPPGGDGSGGADPGWSWDIF